MGVRTCSWDWNFIRKNTKPSRKSNVYEPKIQNPPGKISSSVSIHDYTYNHFHPPKILNCPAENISQHKNNFSYLFQQKFSVINPHNLPQLQIAIIKCCLQLKNKTQKFNFSFTETKNMNHKFLDSKTQKSFSN